MHKFTKQLLRKKLNTKAQVGRSEKFNVSRIVVKKLILQSSGKFRNKRDSDTLMNRNNRLTVEAQVFSFYLRLEASNAHSSQPHSASQNQKSTRLITRRF